MDPIEGFSRLTADEKLSRLAAEGLIGREDLELIRSFRHQDPAIFSFFEKMTENVVAGYHLPYSIAPNFLINGKTCHVPMVTEESSVVAAASWSAKFWRSHGGFQTKVIDEVKLGQIHFTWEGSYDQLFGYMPILVSSLSEKIRPLTERMESRGGGLAGIELIDFTDKAPNLYQLRASFRTADAMGANFINTCLEAMSQILKEELLAKFPSLGEPEIIMSILSNYTPDCLVSCTVECPVDELREIRGVESPQDFARRFALAVRIAQLDPYRAVTHNKGIYNGIDSVVLSTANDFRAVEAGGHAFASRTGSYTSLTHIESNNDTFRYVLTVPMAVGTVGGLTSAHPLARLSLKILGNPSAAELMQIAAAAGMANNFSAIKALTTKGIQEGHMRLHKRKSH
jgi:hydroxymethylglutaryl-CoA reductase